MPDRASYSKLFRNLQEFSRFFGNLFTFPQRMNTATLSTGRLNKRLVFIDILRAYAILMMLQGHFTDTLLATEYRDLTHPLYALWFFMRGMTAPIFFFASGLIFTYLLLKDNRPWRENERVRKGINRGFGLLAIGFVLKLNILALFFGYISPHVYTLDVLHNIGMALLVLIGLYIAHQQFRLPFWPLLLAGGLLFFAIDPLFSQVDYSQWPRVLANFFTRDYGSTFTPIPWVGYTLLGGSAGYLLQKRSHWAFGHVLPLAFLSVGLLLSFYATYPAELLYQLTGWSNFRAMIENNHLLWRLGHVLVVVAIFMWGVARLPRVPALLPKIGSETLTIYGVHYVLLYGTWLGVGISQILGRSSLDPWACFFGALLFEFFFILLIIYIEPLRAFWSQRILRPVQLQWRLSHVRLWQFAAHQSRRNRWLPTIMRQML